VKVKFDGKRSSAVPVFVIVTIWTALVTPTATLPKLREVGVRERMGAGVEDTPVPESCTTFGDPAAFVVIVTVPVRVPESVGVKVIFSIQLAPGARAL
jgi:hypothetical protein